MGVKYREAPIIEALCEFRFEPSQPWDLTIPGLFYREVQAEFPKRRQVNSFRMDFQVEGQGQVVQNVGGNADRMRFMREDERALIQVGPDLLSVNHLKPYPNWETFEEMIARALAIYRRVAEPEAINRIGLRYINRLEVPEAEVEIEDYLRAVPTVPSAIPQVFGPWMQRVEIPFFESNGYLVLSSSSLSTEVDQSVAFLLDLDFITLEPRSVELDSAMEWVEKAHNEVEKTFEACVTPKARRLFGEEERYGKGKGGRAQRG